MGKKGIMCEKKERKASCALFFCLGRVQERITSLTLIDLQRWQSIINSTPMHIIDWSDHSRTWINGWVSFNVSVHSFSASAYLIREDLLKFTIAPCGFTRVGAKPLGNEWMSPEAIRRGDDRSTVAHGSSTRYKALHTLTQQQQCGLWAGRIHYFSSNLSLT